MLPYESRHKTGLRVRATPEDMAASGQAVLDAFKASPLLHVVSYSAAIGACTAQQC